MFEANVLLIYNKASAKIYERLKKQPTCAKAMALQLQTKRDLRDKGLPEYDEPRVLANSQPEWRMDVRWERDDP
jgi:hypothetical protein